MLTGEINNELTAVHGLGRHVHALSLSVSAAAFSHAFIYNGVRLLIGSSSVS